MTAHQLAPFIAAVVLAGVYALGAGAGEARSPPGFGSAADGSPRRLASRSRTSSSGVLPELASQNEALRQAAAGESFFDEQRIYLLALLSFVVMYGIEHIVLSRHEQRREAVARKERDAVYRLHLAGFAAYSGLIGYLLVERAERGHAALAVYAFAMAIHFVVVNHALAEEHDDVYRRHGHWVLAASVVAGWALGTTAVLSEAAFARLFALLAGGVVITSLRAELPDDRHGRFWPFCLGAVIFAVVLLFADSKTGPHWTPGRKRASGVATLS